MAKKAKPSTSRHLPVPVEMIERRIYLIRRQKVMLDSDLAELYGVQTFNLNKAVKRNRERFPEDFMFQLTKLEADALTFQFGMSKPGGVTGKAREGLPMSIDADCRLATIGQPARLRCQ